MSLDRHLIDTIKERFAGKSSAQLQEIVQSNDQTRWSPEAMAAAEEVLQDRMAGRTPEPLTAEEELPPPPSPPLPYSLGFIVGFLPVFALNGFRFGSEFATGEKDDPDLPVPFGPNMAWLALDTTDTAAAAAALGLRGTRAATWAEGIDAAYQSSVFVTPPLGDWTLAVGVALFPPERVEAFVKPLLERLSQQFGDVQYFCTNKDVGLHVWARGRSGRLVRGHGWLGRNDLTLWDEGAQTKEERALSLQLATGRVSQVEQGDSAAPEGPGAPDENYVMHLAHLWSIDPTTLGEQFKEPVTGFLGSLVAGA